MTVVLRDDMEKTVLDLETRKKVYETVRKFAGSHMRELERKCGLSTGLVYYHLNYLAKKGLIEERKDRHNLRYFPKGIHSENKTLMGLLRQRSIRQILVCLLMPEAPNHQQIAAFVKLSPSTTSWHLDKLEKGHIIESVRNGRNKIYRLRIDKNEVVKLLIAYQETFFDKLVDNIIEMWDTR